MKKLFFILPFFLLSCTKQQIKCDLEDGLGGTIAYFIETVGQCSGAAAVRASVNSWVSSANSCSDNVTKMRGSIGICSIVVSALSQAAQGPLDSAINSKFPGWNCDPTMLV